VKQILFILLLTPILSNVLAQERPTTNNYTVLYNQQASKKKNDKKIQVGIYAKKNDLFMGLGLTINRKNKDNFFIESIEPNSPAEMETSGILKNNAKNGSIYIVKIINSSKNIELKINKQTSPEEIYEAVVGNLGTFIVIETKTLGARGIRRFNLQHTYYYKDTIENRKSDGINVSSIAENKFLVTYYKKYRAPEIILADNDSDGVPDKLDFCPFEKGEVTFRGCPAKENPFSDRDNDAIEDMSDSCPDIYGSVSNFGCPEKEQVSINSNGPNSINKLSFCDTLSMIIGDFVNQFKNTRSDSLFKNLEFEMAYGTLFRTKIPLPYMANQFFYSTGKIKTETPIYIGYFKERIEFTKASSSYNELISIIKACQNNVGTFSFKETVYEDLPKTSISIAADEQKLDSIYKQFEMEIGLEKSKESGQFNVRIKIYRNYK